MAGKPRKFTFSVHFKVQGDVWDALQVAAGGDLDLSDYCRHALRRSLVADGYLIPSNGAARPDRSQAEKH